jgi:hypothetical protein
MPKAKVKAKTPEVAGPFDSKQVALLDHDHELPIARFSPCGKFLFAGSYDSNLYRWDIPPAHEAAPAGLAVEEAAHAIDKKVAISAHKAWVQGIVFHPDCKQMFTADSWGNICAWDYAAAEPKPKWTRPQGHSRWMRSLAISPDGALLATCGADRIIKLWSTADGSPKWESPVQPHDLFSVQFHPKGDLVVGDLFGSVDQWDLSAKKIVRSFDAHILYLRPTVNGGPDINDVGGVRTLSFSPDGKTLACGGAQPLSSGFFTAKPAIVLIDWDSGKQSQILQWEGAAPEDGITLDVIWHPDGFVIGGASGQAGKGALYCWKPGAKAPAYLDKKIVNCRSLSMHPDGRRLAVAQVQPNAGAGGNGRHLKQDAEYFGFLAKIRIFEGAKSEPAKDELKA